MRGELDALKLLPRFCDTRPCDTFRVCDLASRMLSSSGPWVNNSHPNGGKSASVRLSGALRHVPTKSANVCVT